MAEKLEQLLEPVDSSGPRWELKATPLEYLVNLLRSGRLREILEKHKIGKYDLLTKFVEKVKRNFDARIKDWDTSAVTSYPTAEWNREALVTIPGISYKTASLYRMHCFGDKIACLDTHVLRWLRTEGFKGVPKASPSNWDIYRHWENVFLGECYKREVEPNHFDLDLWKQATKK